MTPRIQVVLGTIRPNRFGERPANWIMDRLSARDDLQAQLVDLRDYELPLFDREVAPARSGRDHPAGEIERFASKIDEGDGFVFVGPEYNHGPSGVLKNALDHTFVEWRRKPVAFAGYGNVGGARAIEQLRQIVVELEMAPLRHAVHIFPDVMIAARSAEPGDNSLFAELDGKLATLIDDLAWWTVVLREGRRP
jgi:NAD(P)H-dependent FMN reductase